MRRWASTLAEVYQEQAVGSRPDWSKISPVIEKSEICEYGALLLLDSMVKSHQRDAAVLRQVVDRLERRYFSTGISTCDDIYKASLLDALDKRYSYDTRTDFLLAVDQLPLTHKVQVVLSAPVSAAPKKKTTKQDPWRNMDPVDMEEWEKRQFLKGEEKVKRTAYVEAKVTPMEPGQKLRSLFALQMLEGIPTMSFDDFMLYVVSWTTNTRCFRGDMLTDAQEAVIRRLMEIPRYQLRPYILSLCAAAHGFTSPSAPKLWRDKLIPTLVRIHTGKWDVYDQRNLEHLDSPFQLPCCMPSKEEKAKAVTPRSLYGAQLVYSLRRQPLTQELVAICEDWIPSCEGWTMQQAVLVCQALRSVRRTRIHDRLAACVPSLSGTPAQWAELAAALESARPTIWDRCEPEKLVSADEEIVLMMLRSMEHVPEARESFAFQDLQDTFRRRNRDIPVSTTST